MLYTLINILWNALNKVFSWFMIIYKCFDVTFTSLVLAALAFSSIIGYIISPYISNPLRSADQERDRREQARVRRRRQGGKR